MNAVMESVYTDRSLLEQRQANPLSPLGTPLDPFSSYLHEEMRQCYHNGHDHAAIVTACAVLDSVLKDAIYFDEYIKADCRFARSTWDEIDGLEFGPLIHRARRNGVTDKKQHKALEWFRKNVRNVWMHGSTPPDLKDFVIVDVVQANLQTGRVRARAIKAGSNLPLQRMMRIVADRKWCAQVVPFADGMIRALTSACHGRLQEWSKRHPGKSSRKRLERVLKHVEQRGINPDFIMVRDTPEG